MTFLFIVMLMLTGMAPWNGNVLIFTLFFDFATFVVGYGVAAKKLEKK
jgi:hypothetical protein